MIDAALGPEIILSRNIVRDSLKQQERPFSPVEAAAANFFSVQVEGANRGESWAVFETDVCDQISDIYRSHPANKVYRRNKIQNMLEPFKGAHQNIRHRIPLLLLAEIANSEVDLQLDPVVALVSGGQKGTDLLGAVVEFDGIAYCLAPSGFFRVKPGEDTDHVELIDPRQFADVVVSKINRQLAARNEGRYYTFSDDKVDPPEEIFPTSGNVQSLRTVNYQHVLNSMLMVSDLIKQKK